MVYLPTFTAGPLAGTVLPSYDGHGPANVMPTVARHFGLRTSLAPLSPAIVPPALLADVDRIVTLLVDALGFDALQAAIAQGAAPHLARLTSRPATQVAALTSTFPSSTPTALTTLHTACAPAHHGVTSDKLIDPQLGLPLSLPAFEPAGACSWPKRPQLAPAVWRARPPIYPALAAHGVSTTILSHRAFADAPFSSALHRGAMYLGSDTFAELCQRLRAVIDTGPTPAYVHAYWGTLDTVAHDAGPGSAAWDTELQRLDAAIGTLLEDGWHAPRTLLLVLADHGQIATEAARWTWLNEHPHLLALLRAPPVGDHRAGVLYVQDGCVAKACAYVTEHLAYCATALPMDEAIERGFYGPGTILPRTRTRMGDVLLLAHENWAVRYEYPGKAQQPWQSGTHGGLSRAEMLVPLIARRLDTVLQTN